ncbi:hypothetical protein Vi05172_g4297 [Venturia inaequalis]|nr:hypothetical protein Vi05172_g4297 [Venturia inaequalis]
MYKQCLSCSAYPLVLTLLFAAPCKCQASPADCSNKTRACADYRIWLIGVLDPALTENPTGQLFVSLAGNTPHNNMHD